MKRSRFIITVTAAALALSSCYITADFDSLRRTSVWENTEYANISADSIPEYSGDGTIPINGNKPYFDDTELVTDSFEYYSELDGLGRCGAAYACLGRDIMPTSERGSISGVKPSGWQSAQYDFVESRSLYNRSHLIGWQLAGEDANERNLITGTRYLNATLMLPFENMVADYIKETDNHVMYRVTPYFEGNNLVAKGVLMEAKSVEDDDIEFDVFCYNVQPGVEIDYATGESRAVNTDAHDAGAEEENEYVLNIGTKKFHLPSCPNAQTIKEKNMQNYKGSREALIMQGYSPCGQCRP